MAGHLSTWIHTTLAITVIAGGMCGCGRKLSRENDALRAQIVELESSLAQLERRNRELRNELAAAAAVPDSLPEEVRAATPHVASVSIGRLSHARDADGDGRIDRLILYVNPADGLGRFVQFAGTLSVTAAILPPDTDPISIGRQALSPLRLRDTYRSSLTGVHYTIELPVTLPPQADEPGYQQAVVRVVYTDGRTGQGDARSRSSPTYSAR